MKVKNNGNHLAVSYDENGLKVEMDSMNLSMPELRIEIQKLFEQLGFGGQRIEFRKKDKPSMFG